MMLNHEMISNKYEWILAEGSLLLTRLVTIFAYLY